jgi:alpha-1,3-glucan synthase
MSTLSVADSFAMRQQDDHDQDFSALGLGAPQPFYQQANRNSTQLSLQDVVGDRSDLKLQQPEANFTDANGELYARFDRLLEDLTPSNSQNELCIAEILRKGEKEWFNRYRDAKLGISVTTSSKGSRPSSRRRTSSDNGESPAPNPENSKRIFGASSGGQGEFQMGEYYNPPTGLKK